jgi:hypothetical protein
MTTAEIATLIAQNVNDNTVGDITPAELRAVLNALNENQQSGEFESTLTVTGGGSATLAGKLLYQKIGNIVSISGTIDLAGVDNNKIVPSLPFAQDTTKPLNFTCTLSNGLQYNELRAGTSFNLGVQADPANDNKLTILLRSDTITDNYTIFFSGHYVCV